jgi:hypothetical protein
MPHSLHPRRCGQLVCLLPVPLQGSYDRCEQMLASKGSGMQASMARLASCLRH